MKKYLFVILILMCYSISYSQDLRGKWENIALEDSMTYDDIIFTTKQGNTYFGDATDKDSSGEYCHYKIKGEFNSETKLLSANEYELIEKTPNHRWCVFKLYYIKEGINEYLEGFVRIKKDDGTLSLPNYVKYWRKAVVSEDKLKMLQNYKTQRKNKKVASINVTTSKIKLKVYDYGKVDHDTISIFYNNSLLAHKIAIDKEVEEIDFELDHTTKEHKLFFIANNVGDIPPNTTRIELYIGDKKYEYTLFTDEKSNAIIQLNSMKE